MKYLILLLFLIGCTSAPKYKIGDCVNMSAMTITETGEWDSSGHWFGSFKIVDIIETDKMNKYMAKDLHAHNYYKIKMMTDAEKDRGYYKKLYFVIPVSDLDNYRYSNVFWPPPEYNKENCNSYLRDK